MTSGELRVLMALDKLGEYVQNGIPLYKSINVSFYQKQSNNSVEYTELSNNSEYTIDVVGVSAGRIEVTTDIPDFRITQVFVSPLTHPSDYCAIEITGDAPYIFNLYSINAGVGADARGFGNDGLSRVTFEIRIYPEPA